MKYLQMLLLFLLSNSCFSQKLECADLLQKYATKWNKIEFIECKTGTGQTVLEANYRVLGKDSKEIEELLTSKYGMGKLKFYCCGWEPLNGKKGYIKSQQLKSVNQNYVLEISMFADAEKKNKEGKAKVELDRNKLNFELIVKVLEI